MFASLLTANRMRHFDALDLSMDYKNEIKTKYQNILLLWQRS